MKKILSAPLLTLAIGLAPVAFAGGTLPEAFQEAENEMITRLGFDDLNDFKAYFKSHPEIIKQLNKDVSDQCNYGSPIPTIQPLNATSALNILMYDESKNDMADFESSVTPKVESYLTILNKTEMSTLYTTIYGDLLTSRTTTVNEIF